MLDILYVKWDVSPEIFRILGLPVRWYGILFLSGFLLGIWLFSKFYKREGLPSVLLDPILWATLLFALIGARLGHVLFYQPEEYLANPIEILKVWHGGLASHGGAIGVLFAVRWYVKKYGKKYGFDYIWILDRLAVAIPFAGALIRIGNLMNSEIYGYETTLPWGFIFVRNGETMPHHPTQLYEASAYLLLGIMMLIFYYKLSNKQWIYKGFMFGLFLFCLFGARFLIEFVKEPQVEGEIGKLLNNGQLLSIPFIIAGIIFMVWSFIKKKPVLLEKK